jgi:glutamyl-tRNA synthetase
LIKAVLPRLEAVEPWEAAGAEQAVRTFAEESGVKLGAIAQPLRSALTGRVTSPGIFEVLTVLGKDESLSRLRDQAEMPAT